MTLTLGANVVAQRRLSDIIYDALMAALVTGKLAPGEPLNDKDLAADLSVSRTPVREALQRLQDVGLVEIAPGRYTRVTPLNLRRTSDIARLAGHLCALGVELAAPRLTPDDLDRLENELTAFADAVREHEQLEIARSVWAFYDIFLARAGNVVLADTIARLQPEINRWTLVNPQWRPLPNLTRKRRRIVTAARAGDPAAASEAVIQLWTELAEAIRRDAPHETAAFGAGERNELSRLPTFAS